MTECRHAILSLPTQVEADGLVLHDHALRQTCPINETAARVLGKVDGTRSVEDIAVSLTTDGEPEELIDPILNFADVMNRAYLLNASKPFSWQEAKCRIGALWNQLITLQGPPLPDGRARTDLTVQQQCSTFWGAVRVARFSLAKILPILGLAVGSILALVMLTSRGLDLSTFVLFAALCGGAAGCLVLHELGHYFAFSQFEPPPRRLFLKSALGTCGLNHAPLNGRAQSFITTAAGPLLPLLVFGGLALLPLLPTEIRLLFGALAVSQVIGLSPLTSDGRRLFNLLRRNPRGA
jgi:hypothetical protein